MKTPTSCEKCNSQLEKTSTLVNTHTEFSPKFIRLLQCPACRTKYFQVSFTTLSLGKPYNFTNRIVLKKDEFEMLTDIFEECPDKMLIQDCKCISHEMIEQFEIDNVGRKRLVQREEDIF